MSRRRKTQPEAPGFRIQRHAGSSKGDQPIRDAVAAASQRRRRDHAAYSGALIGGLLTMLALWPAHVTPATRPVVYLAPIEGMIDLGLAPFVRRVLDEAAAAGAAAVILEVNTFGGRVDAAVLIRDALLGSRIRTVAFVNKRAISAGALISLAAETDHHGRRWDDRGGHPRGARRARRAGAARGGEDRVLHAQGVSRDRREPEAAALARRGHGGRRCDDSRRHRQGEAPDPHDPGGPEARPRGRPRGHPRRGSGVPRPRRRRGAPRRRRRGPRRSCAS